MISTLPSMGGENVWATPANMIEKRAKVSILKYDQDFSYREKILTTFLCPAGRNMIEGQLGNNTAELRIGSSAFL